MTFSVSSYDLEKYVPMFIMILVVLFVITFVAFNLMRNKDNNKPTRSFRGKIIEKRATSFLAHDYIVESENGERTKLRAFDRSLFLLSPNDIGKITIRGNTLVCFKREG